MIRFGLVVWLIVATGVAVGLYHIKYEVKDLERELEQVRQDIQKEREALHILEAEWSYLNRPARLARLAEKHLGMAPAQPRQIVRVDQIPPRVTVSGKAGAARLDESGSRRADAPPLPARKPWSLQPQLSRAATPFLREASR